MDNIYISLFCSSWAGETVSGLRKSPENGVNKGLKQESSQEAASPACNQQDKTPTQATSNARIPTAEQRQRAIEIRIRQFHRIIATISLAVTEVIIVSPNTNRISRYKASFLWTVVAVSVVVESVFFFDFQPAPCETVDILVNACASRFSCAACDLGT